MKKIILLIMILLIISCQNKKDSDVIVSTFSYKIERTIGNQWASGLIDDYDFIITGDDKEKIAIFIMSNCTCEPTYIVYQYTLEKVVLKIDTDDAMCFYEFCEKLKPNLLNQK